jgi:putative transposase
VPATHTSLQYHFVFSTKDRLPLIATGWRDRLHEYLGGAIRSMDGIAHAVGGVADHVHLLVGLKPTHVISNVLRDIKRSSSVWIRDEVSVAGFTWQAGFGAFTVSPPRVEGVIRYIKNQEQHHRVRSFQDEYRALLKSHGVAFEERYMW